MRFEVRNYHGEVLEVLLFKDLEEIVASDDLEEIKQLALGEIMANWGWCEGQPTELVRVE